MKVIEAIDITDKVVEEEESWAVSEFAEADLKDARRTKRLIEIATVLAERPGASIPEACGSKAMAKATYRFFDNEAIEPNDILESQVAALSGRIAKVGVVLAVQDTTELNFSHHPETLDLGVLSGGYDQGLMVHTTLAMTPERVALGIVAQEVWARDPNEMGKAKTRKTRPIEEKESHKWLTSLRGVIELSQEHPDVHFVSVGDREADVYNLFLVERPDNVDLLVRAAWDRRVDHPEKYLWASVQAKPLAGEVVVEVPRRGKQPARKATLEVRFGEVTLCPPKHRKAQKLPKILVRVIQALEKAPPEGVEAIEWLLLSTWEVPTVEEAIKMLQWYACRWGIEVFHKVLKSGCRIEARQLETAERLKRCLPVFCVVAWRILYTTMLSRVLPDVACTAVLEEEEWQAWYCRIHHTATLPKEVPTLRQAVHWIARLGGFLDRKSDGEPGVTVLWKGFQHLIDLTAMYRILRPTLPDQKNVGNG